VIKTFKGEWAEMILANRKVPKGFPVAIAKVARRKLIMVNNAGALDDLKSPPATDSKH
jgi:toxin HigB-1